MAGSGCRAQALVTTRGSEGMGITLYLSNGKGPMAWLIPMVGSSSEHQEESSIAVASGFPSYPFSVPLVHSAFLLILPSEEGSPKLVKGRDSQCISK